MKKKTLLLTLFLVVLLPKLLAQKNSNNQKLVYTFGVNEVPNGCNIPLLGIVNTAHGDHKSVHIGMINSNSGQLSGAQIGFINTVGGNQKGLQVGFINTIGDNAQGFQVGFINTIGRKMQGSQIGFINAVKNIDGVQVSFINATENMKGFQVGFINATNRMKGAQIGFINTSMLLSGIQLGFINRVDRVVHGAPVGFLSFVKHGGFQAFEFSFNEMYPYNVSYKIGVDKFYTFPMISYNPDFVEPYAIGFGAGANIPLNEEVYFNPEFVHQSVLSGDFEQIASYSLNFGHTFTDRLDFLAGPSLVWNMTTNQNPLFTLHDWTVDGNTRIHVGFRLALRYRF